MKHRRQKICPFLLALASLLYSVPVLAAPKKSFCEADKFTDVVTCGGVISPDQRLDGCEKGQPSSADCAVDGGLKWEIQGDGQAKIYTAVPVWKERGSSLDEFEGLKRKRLRLKTRVNGLSPEWVVCQKETGYCDLTKVVSEINCRVDEGSEIVTQAEEVYGAFFSWDKKIEREIRTYKFRQLRDDICEARKQFFASPYVQRNLFSGGGRIRCEDKTEYGVSFFNDNKEALLLIPQKGKAQVLEDNEVATGSSYGNDNFTYEEGGGEITLFRFDANGKTSERVKCKSLP